jgi:hypothetical protein
MRINEARLHEASWGLGVLQYVQVLRLPDATPCGEEVLGPLLHLLRHGAVCEIEDPELTAFSLRVPIQVQVGVRVQVDGEDYIYVARIRNATTLREGNVSVFVSRDNHCVLCLDQGAKLTYHPEHKIFLSIDKELCA